MKKLQILCGLNNIRNVVLVTTRWTKTYDPVALGKQRRHEKELAKTYWKTALDRGSTMERYSGTKESAMAILTILNSREQLFDPTEPFEITQIEDDNKVSQTDATIDLQTPIRRTWKWWLWQAVQLLLSLIVALFYVGFAAGTINSFFPEPHKGSNKAIVKAELYKVSLLWIYAGAMIIVSDLVFRAFTDIWLAASVFAWGTLLVVITGNFVEDYCEEARLISWIVSPIMISCLGYGQYWHYILGRP